MPSESYQDWIRKAEGDFRTATRESKVRRVPNYDAVCVHSQPCVEKYLKAFRISHGRNYRRVHALIPLLEDCIEIDPSFELVRTPCDDITGIDQFRYPADFANERDAALALKSARIVRKFIREKLELRKRRGNRTK